MFPVDLFNVCCTNWPDVFEDMKLNPDDTVQTTAKSLISMRARLMKHAKLKCGQCTSCELHRAEECSCRSGVIWEDGCVNSPIFVIGHGIDKDSIRSGAPFHSSSDSSLAFNSILNDCGLVRWSDEWHRKNVDASYMVSMPHVYITTAYKCGGNERFHPECWKWMAIQLFIVQPLVVIVMGNNAAKFVYDGIKVPRRGNNCISMDVDVLQRAQRLPGRVRTGYICGSPNIFDLGTASSDTRKAVKSSIIEAFTCAKADVRAYLEENK